MNDGVPTIVVHPASPSDAASILAIHRRVLEEGDWFITEVDELRDSVEAKVAQIRDARRERGGLLVARLSDVVVGWLAVSRGFRRRNRHVGRLEMMVDAPFRGRGVGDALLGAAVEWARREGLGKLSLTVFAHNARAIALYERHGFVVEGRRVAEYRFADGSERDDLLMALRL